MIDPTTLVPCPACDGTGHTDFSECCGAAMWEDDLCMECKEHSSYQDCEFCDGRGEVTEREEKSIIKEMQNEY